jgi:hypothetical protein
MEVTPSDPALIRSKVTFTRSFCCACGVAKALRLLVNFNRNHVEVEVVPDYAFLEKVV